MRIGLRRPTRYVLVPGPVIMPGFKPSTRPTRSVGVAVVGKFGSIQLMVGVSAGRSSSWSVSPSVSGSWSTSPDPMGGLAASTLRHSEVAALDVLVGGEPLRWPFPDDLPFVHHVDAIGDAQRQVVVLLH